MGSTTQHHARATHLQPAIPAVGAGLDDDGGFLARLHAGDRAAFADLYRTHLPRLTRHVAARLDGRNPDVAADLIHDVFADALADPTLIGADMLGSLLRLCDRACTRHLWSQRRHLRAAHTVYADHQRADLHTPRPDAQARQAAAEAMAALPERERRVMQLRFLDGHPRDLTALLLGRSVDTVTYLERRACQRMRQYLGTNPPDAPHAATSAANAARHG
jgi:RNA polymerase sigma-70 factor (ECF subfamily)